MVWYVEMVDFCTIHLMLSGTGTALNTRHMEVHMHTRGAKLENDKGICTLVVEAAIDWLAQQEM